MPHDFQDDIDTIQGITAVPMILDVVCRATGMGFAAVARVTEDRWIACQVLDNADFGLAAGGELRVESTLCHEVRQFRQVVVIDNVAEDPVYRGHHTPTTYGLQSYISMPILLPDGSFFGTLCAIDAKPAKLNNPQILGTFKLFAELIAYHLDAAQNLKDARESLFNERQTSELREQFIAVLGHDLRNPLASIDAGINMFMRKGWDERSPMILRLMKSSVMRIGGLIDNVLDLARSRLGGGITLNLEPARPLAPTVQQVIDELSATYPERCIVAHLDIAAPVAVDHNRIAQMLSNLLGNALTHGADSAPISVEAAIEGDEFYLKVANAGTPIPPEVSKRLFQPFYRGQVSKHAEGLGLGLYIAAQIAAAHGGTLDVTSDASATQFTFRMPCAGPG